MFAHLISADVLAQDFVFAPEPPRRLVQWWLAWLATGVSSRSFLMSAWANDSLLPGFTKNPSFFISSCLSQCSARGMKKCSSIKVLVCASGLWRSEQLLGESVHIAILRGVFRWCDRRVVFKFSFLLFSNRRLPVRGRDADVTCVYWSSVIDCWSLAETLPFNRNSWYEVMTPWIHVRQREYYNSVHLSNNCETKWISRVSFASESKS